MIHDYKILMPMRRLDWMTPSRAQPKNMFGLENRTLFHVRARLADGHVRWHGVIEDREDADAFLWAHVMGNLDQQPDLWRIPVPQYFPEYQEGAELFFVTQITWTTSGSTSVPGDWNNSSNTVEGIGGGGSGSCGCKANGNRVTGGSGAEYRKLTNYTPSGTFNYTIGAGGAAVSRTTAGITAGNDGTDTVLDTTALIAKKGLAGTGLNGSAPTAPSGGTGGTGGTGNNGGAGGATSTFNDCASGAGGAGGPSGAGNAGATVSANNSGSNGGSAGGGSGGAGGAGNSTNSASPTAGGNGGNGTEWTSSGSGGGGGACTNPNGSGTGTATGGSGGSYGGGGGGANTKNGGGDTTSGAGVSGIIVVIYTPIGGGVGARSFGYIF